MAELVTGALPPLEDGGGTNDGFVEVQLNKDGTPRKKRGRPPGSKNSGGGSISNLEGKLAESMRAYIGGPIAVISPLAMAVVDDRADRTASALCTVAARSPKMKKALETFVSSAGMMELALFPIGIAFAVMVDLGKVPYNSLPSRHFKIDKFAAELYGTEAPILQTVEPDGRGSLV